MAENMFQEGLYQVYVKETPPTRPVTQARPVTLVSNHEELGNVRIHRWFRTVVSTRLVVSGVVQILSAFACILTTITHACVSYKCSVSMATPVWSSLCYIAAGCLALGVQRRANKLKVIFLMGLNLLSLLLGFSALLAYTLRSEQQAPLNTSKQRAGSYVAKGSSIAFTAQCLVLSGYMLFLSWRGLRRYSPPRIPAYSRIAQDPDESSGPLLEEEDLNL
ncbi:transmembrane protein 253 [Aulostomus maculatus]